MVTPLQYVMWGYLTAGLVFNAVDEAMEEYGKGNPRPVFKSTRFGWVFLTVVLWPLFLIVTTVIGIGSLIKTLKVLYHNRTVSDEAAKLKEEVERLKDRLFELEG